MAIKRPVPQPPRHPLLEDGDIPADHRGRRRCRRCGVLGEPGDQRHSDEFPETPEAAKEIDERILGEG